jgi:hypothetical protein
VPARSEFRQLPQPDGPGTGKFPKFLLFVRSDCAGKKNDTLWQKQDFIVLPLEAEMVRPIMAAVGETVPRGLIHIQIQKVGRLQLGLYDNFAPDSMFFGPGLTSFIATMQEAGVLTHWTER